MLGKKGQVEGGKVRKGEEREPEREEREGSRGNHKRKR